MADEVAAFSHQADRSRLTCTALKALTRIMDAWQTNEADAAALIAVSIVEMRAIRSGEWNGIFTRDQLIRISALVGIYAALKTTFADDNSARWPSRCNTARMFDGHTPIEAMIAGGTAAMLDTRRHVEAMSVGL